MATKISVHDFDFTSLGCRKYLVEYKSPLSGRVWRQHVSNVSLIESVMNSNSPRARDLKALFFVCKNGYSDKGSITIKTLNY